MAPSKSIAVYFRETSFTVKLTAIDLLAAIFLAYNFPVELHLGK